MTTKEQKCEHDMMKNYECSSCGSTATEDDLDGSTCCPDCGKFMARVEDTCRECGKTQDEIAEEN